MYIKTAYHQVFFNHTSLVVLLTLVFSVSASSAPPNYEDDIRPVFENACFNCHNPDKQKGDLDLTTYSAAMRGGSGGKFAEPGDGADSKIYGVITHTLKPKMPPKGDKLDKKEAELIRAWVDGGLLENKSGKPRQKKRPAYVLSSAPSAAKPEGPPPMPEHVLLEPVVTSARASVVADMAASPWAPLLAITGQRQVVLYDTDNMEMVGIFPFEHGQPEVLSFHPSGKYLLAGGGVGGKSGTTVTWDVKTASVVLRAGKDYDAVIAASLRSDLGGVSLGGPGKRVKLWDTALDEQVISIKKHTDWVTKLAYSPDGVLLASGGRGGDLYVWEADTGNAFHHLRGHKAAITGMAWRSDSNVLATVSEDGQMIIWEMNNGKQIKKLVAHKGGALAIDWNHNGHLVTGGRDRKVRLWKPDFKPLRDFPVFDELINEVSFSYDGKRVFAAGWSGLITVIDVASGDKLGVIKANPPAIASRIETLLEEVGSSENKLAIKSKSLEVAADKLAEASGALAEIEQRHDDAVVTNKNMFANRSKVESAMREMGVELESLNKERQQLQHALTKAREINHKHNAALTVSHRDHQQAEKEGRKLLDIEKRMLDSLERIMQAVEKKPKDEKLAAQVAELQSKIEAHRRKLSDQLKQTETRKLAFLNLTEGQKKPGDQLARADAAWRDINQKYNSYQAKRKQLNDDRNALNKKLSEHKRLMNVLQKEMKSAHAEYMQIKGGFSKAEDDFNIVAEKNKSLFAGIKHWRAATVNAEAIKLNDDIVQLEVMLHENMDKFTLAAEDAGKIHDRLKFEAKVKEIAGLRSKIDQMTPLLMSKQVLFAEKKERYQQMISQ